MSDNTPVNPPGQPRDDRQLTDAAVVTKTGKRWAEWFAILDAAGGDQMDHRQIVAYLYRAHVVSPWWQQMVAVTYEQERARRLRQGDAVDRDVVVTMSVPASVAAAYDSWTNPEQRESWPAEQARVDRAIPERSARISLDDGRSFADVEFHPKLDGTSQVTVRQEADSETAEALRSLWTEALVRLVAELSRPDPFR